MYEYKTKLSLEKTDIKFNMGALNCAPKHQTLILLSVNRYRHSSIDFFNGFKCSNMAQLKSYNIPASKA